MIEQGRCAACHAYIWRTVTAQKKNGDTEPGEVFIVWPIPTSVYVNTWVDGGWTVGIGYCRACVPDFGAPGPDGFGPIVGWETAKDRYGDWYSDAKGEFYRAWMADHIAYDDVQVQAAMKVWENDRNG